MKRCWRLIPAPQRFWLQTDVRGPDECWEWTGARTDAGYGRIRVDGVQRQATHVAWELLCGPVPDGFFACHRCDNPPCVNSRHLFLGTAKENSDDMRMKQREGHGAPPPRLTQRQAHEIRERYAEGGISQRELAATFGVHQMTVSRLVRDQIKVYA